MPRPFVGDPGLSAGADQAEFVHLLEFEFSGGLLRMNTGAQDLVQNPYGTRIGATIDRFYIRNPVGLFPTGDFSVEFWGRLDAGFNGAQPNWAYSYAVVGGPGTPTNHILLGLESVGGFNRLGCWIGGTQATTDDENYPDDHAWRLFTFTWKQTSGEAKIYLNGVLKHTTVVSAGVSIIAAGALVLGQDQDAVGGGLDATQAWKGDLDEVRTYARVLSPLEVTQHYNRLYVNETQLVGYWRFDVAASNVLLNPGGELGNGTGWTFDQASVVNDGNARTGSFAIKYIGDGTGGPNERNTGGRLSVKPGDQIYLECWTKTAAGTGTSSLAVRWYLADGVTIIGGGRFIVTGGVSSLTGPVAAYTKMYGIAYAPATAAYAEFDWGENTANNTATPWYIDDCVLTQSAGADSSSQGNDLTPVGIIDSVTDPFVKKIWDGFGGLLQFGGVEETSDSKGQGVDVKLSGVDQTVLAILLNNEYRGRPARIYRAYLDSTLGIIIPDPILLIEGLQLDKYELKEDRSNKGGTVTISTRITSRLGVDRARGLWANLMSHQHIFYGDTFFQYVATLANSSVYWGTNLPTRVGETRHGRDVHG